MKRWFERRVCGNGSPIPKRTEVYTIDNVVVDKLTEIFQTSGLYDSVYLTCSKKLTGSQLSLPQTGSPQCHLPTQLEDVPVSTILGTLSALEALCDYALYKSTFTLHYITNQWPTFIFNFHIVLATASRLFWYISVRY